VIRALALVALLAGFVDAPTGWFPDADQANAFAAKANALSHFGGARAVATVQVFVAPQGGGLYVTAVAGKVKDHKDAAARVALDAFLDAPKRAQLTSERISIVRSNSRIIEDKKLIEGVLDWKDDQTSTRTLARLVIAGDSENLVAVTAECVIGDATSAAMFEACEKALRSLDPEIPVDARVLLALAPEGTEPPPGPSMPAGSGSAPTMSEGPRKPMAPITVPTEPQRTVDRRPVYVGAGIVVLAGLFWWNRRRRERLEATAATVKKDPDE